jgi:hypothetical protein
MATKAITLALATILGPSLATHFMAFVDQQAPIGATLDEDYIQICPNPDYQGLNETVPCLEIYNLTAPRSSGQVKTCGELVSFRLQLNKTLT